MWRTRFAIRVLAGVGAVLLAATVVLAIEVRRRTGGVVSTDASIESSIHTFAGRHPDFAESMRVVSAVGGPSGWWVVLAPIFGWLLYRRRYRTAAFVAVSGLGSALLNRLIKMVVNRPRPVLDHPLATAAGKSFPSGHTQAAIVGCGIVLVVVLPIVKTTMRAVLSVVAALVVALIGFSRIALGVHFLSDVVAALLIGALWLLAMIAAFRPWDDPSGPARRRSGGGCASAASGRR